MELLEASEFLRRAAKHGIVPDPACRDRPWQASLKFAIGPPYCSQWITPEAPSNLPGFTSCLLACAAPGQAVYLFVKGGAPWFTGSDPNTGPEWEHLRDRVVGILPIPRDFRGTLKMASTEADDVVLLMVTFLVYAWCPTDDLQIVPEDGNVIMQTSHHGQVLVQFPDEERMKTFVSSMAERGFPTYKEGPA